MEHVPLSERLDLLAEDAAKRILLLDCDNLRREIRAKALMNRGALVDRAAETAVARTLWKPGTYDLILVDLRGADADCAAFISFVHGACAGQKFGFYIAQPPYLTASVARCRSALQQSIHRAVADRAPHDGHSARNGDRTGLAVASQRIADARQSARLRAHEPEATQGLRIREEPSRPRSISDAVRLAGRVLGGS